MSNPNFPGPSWQDRSETPGGSAAYRGTAGGDGRASNGWAANGGWTRDYEGQSNGSSRAPYEGNSGHGYAGNGGPGTGRGESRRANGDDAGYGRNGAAHGRSGRGGNGRSEAGYGRDAGYGRNDAAYGRGDATRAGDPWGAGAGGRGSRRARGAADGRRSSGYGADGTAAYGGNDDSRYGRSGRGPEEYGAGGDTGYARSGRRPAGLRSGRERYGERTASYRNGTGLIGDGSVPLPGTGDGDFGGPGGPDDPYWPGGPGGPGRRGGGRRGSRGFDPGRRPPGSLLERLWRGSWWRRWTLKKAAAVMGAMALGTALILIAGFFYIYNSVELPIKQLSAPLIESSVVYFADGKTEVGCFCTTNRTVLTAAQLAQDKYLEQAFFAAEDRHFLTEGGISLTGTARAILVDLTGNGYQGGSTITEQYVKTYFQQAGGNLTYKEKIEEIIDAIKLNKARDKEWILSHYLNAIYLGHGAYGVEAAAQTYFGKDAWNLDAPQAAMLAAMVQAPSSFDPYHPAKKVPELGYSLLDRWVSVLVNMAGDTFPNGQPVLTEQQINRLVPDPHNPPADLKNFPKRKPLSSAAANWSGFRGYIMAAVQTELERYHYHADRIGSAGLHITTTFSLRKMRALYKAIAEAKRMMRDGGQRLPVWARIGAVLENPRNGAIEAMYGGPDFTAKHCKRISCQYDTATVARSQVGSSFKPYVLATAVHQGMNVATSRLNGTSPLCIPPDDTEQHRMTLSKPERHHSCPTLWAPIPYDPATRDGPVTVAAATAASSNPAFVDLAHRVGTREVVRMAKRFGVDIRKFSDGGSNLSQMLGQTGIALGIASLTVEEQASTFATLANRGNYHTPHVIAKIIRNGQPVQIKVTHRKVLSPKETADVDWALSFDTNSGSGYTGTGTNAILSPYRPTIAKTGTTDRSQAAFFIGALPSQYSFAVGMFTKDPSDTSETLAVLPSTGGWTGGYGGAWPATIWRLYMTRLLAMSHKPIASLDPLNVTGMSKWIQAKPLKPKCQQPGPGGGGTGGPGKGHGHNHGIFTPAITAGPKCPSPSPSPSPSGFPSPGPSPSTSPSPSPSGFPTSGSPSPPAPAALASPAQTSSVQVSAAQAPAGRLPARKQTTGTPSLTTAATLERPLSTKPGWAVTTTGLA